MTEKNFFNGSNNDILNARKITELPILRKDFIIDEYQIYESKVYQADIILLIVSVLNDEQLRKFLEIAKDLELDVIIETHNEEEIKRALKLKYPIVVRLMVLLGIFLIILNFFHRRRYLSILSLLSLQEMPKDLLQLHYQSKQLYFL